VAAALHEEVAETRGKYGHNRTFGDNRVAGYAASVQHLAMLNVAIDKQKIVTNSGYTEMH